MKGSPDLSSAELAVQGRAPAAVRLSSSFSSLSPCSARTVLAGKGNILSQALSAVVRTLLNVLESKQTEQGETDL